MAKTTNPLISTCFPKTKTLCALLVGLTITCVMPVYANSLPEVQSLIKQRQYSQALEKVDAYLGSRPKDAQGRFLKGLIYTEMNKPAEAIAVFTKLSEDYPELPEPYNNLAVLYAQQRQYDKARTALEMAIRTHPSYAIAYENLGDIYAKLASQAYDKALQLDNSNSIAQNKLALIRDLISTSGKGNVKPSATQTIAQAAIPNIAPPPSTQPVAQPPLTPPPMAAAPSKPAPQPTANVITSTPGAATISAPQPKPVVIEPPPPAPAKTGTDEEITKAINAWASAWSRKDMRAYLAAYAPDFNTKGPSRKAWEKERENRIAGKSGKISVTVDKPQITVNGDKATAKFRQHYKAGGLDSSTTKTLVLVRSGGKWLIKEENTR